MLDVKLERLEDISLRDKRPQLDGARRNAMDNASREHKSAFDSYVRGGETAALRALETTALSVGSNPDGGYLVPVELEHEISGNV